MKKLSSKKELLEFLKDVRALEVGARKDYEEDILTYKNFEIKETLKKIKLDEDKHIKILDGMIRMLER